MFRYFEPYNGYQDFSGFFLNNHLAARIILLSIRLRGWVKIAHSRASVSVPGRDRERDTN